MVDVGDKPVSARTATASGIVSMAEETYRLLEQGALPKGDVVPVARLAGIMAAKKTPELIPLCHPLALDGVAVEIRPRPPGSLVVEATVRCSGRTGVEMEAMTAVSVACLAIYDMLKGVDRGVEIGPIRLMEKAGGRSGSWTRQSP